MSAADDHDLIGVAKKKLANGAWKSSLKIQESDLEIGEGKCVATKLHSERGGNEETPA